MPLTGHIALPPTPFHSYTAYTGSSMSTCGLRTYTHMWIYFPVCVCVCEAQLKPAYRVSVRCSFLASFFLTVLFSCAKGGANVIFWLFVGRKIMCTFLHGGGRGGCWYPCVCVWCSFCSDNKLFSKICCPYTQRERERETFTSILELVEPLKRINAIIEFVFISF